MEKDQLQRTLKAIIKIFWCIKMIDQLAHFFYLILLYLLLLQNAHIFKNYMISKLIQPENMLIF